MCFEMIYFNAVPIFFYTHYSYLIVFYRVLRLLKMIVDSKQYIKQDSGDSCYKNEAMVCKQNWFQNEKNNVIR